MWPGNQSPSRRPPQQAGGEDRIRTGVWRFCKPLPNHLATSPMGAGTLHAAVPESRLRPGVLFLGPRGLGRPGVHKSWRPRSARRTESQESPVSKETSPIERFVWLDERTRNLREACRVPQGPNATCNRLRVLEETKVVTGVQRHGCLTTLVPNGTLLPNDTGCLATPACNDTGVQRRAGKGY